MLINSERMIPVTKLQKELTSRIREVAEEGSPLFVLKNNEMEAVILSSSDYEYLANLAELFETFEIEEMLTERLKKYDRTKNLKWEELR